MSGDIHMQSLDFLADVLAHIEAHLFEPLSVARLARVSGLSPYHFSRLFTARLGESAMGYVRARRLEAAALRLSGAAAPSRLIDLAFDCGFESQEAFSRAFKRRFGVPPGRFRAARPDIPTMEPHMTQAAAARAPRIEQLPAIGRGAFTVAGVQATFDEQNKSGIPGLWPRLLKCLPLPGQVDAQSYGVCWLADRDEGSIHYMAGVEVRGNAPLPDGFARLEIAPQTYAVFRVTLSDANVHRQLQAAMPQIWGKRLAEAGYTLVQAPDFELYPAGFNPAADAHVDICVPVAV